MRVLILGDPGSVYIKEYVQHVLLNSGHTVAILNDTISEIDRAFYQGRGVTILPYFNMGRRFFSKWRYTDQPYRKLLRYINGWIGMTFRPDVVHVHFLMPSRCYMARMFGKRCKKVLSFWGSDLLRADGRRLEHLKQAFPKADIITLQTQDMYDKFVSVYGKEFLPKIRFPNFGSNRLETIKKLSGTVAKSECKKHFGIPADKIVIAVGYNGSEGHQHLKALEGLDTLPKKYKNRICLLLQMTYGTTESYLSRVKNRLEKVQCDAVVLREFLSDEELTMVRMATDIFLQISITDAFSASMQEYLYLNKIVVIGTWLKYSILDQLEIKYYDLASFEELPHMIMDIIDENPTLAEDADIMLEEKIYQMSSWQAVKNGWLELYCS